MSKRYRNNKDYYKTYDQHYSQAYHTEEFKFTMEPINKIIGSLEEKKGNILSIPELTKNLIDDLIMKRLECLICNEEIIQSNEIWSCITCFSILHIKCITEWAIKNNPEYKDKPKADMKFTCPHCSYLHKTTYEALQVYDCFCGKYNTGIRINTNTIFIPHSCGKV